MEEGVSRLRMSEHNKKEELEKSGGGVRRIRKRSEKNWEEE